MVEKQISFPTIEVTLWDNKGEAQEVILIRPAAFNKISEVDRLQRKLMEAYEREKGSLGKLLADSTVYGDMEKIAELVRVVGKNEPGFDLANLYDAGDIVQLGCIFFSESINENMRSPGYTSVDVDGQKVKAYQFPEHRMNPLPSGIARIHDLAFFEMMVEIREKADAAETESIDSPKEETKKTAPLKAVATAS